MPVTTASRGRSLADLLRSQILDGTLAVRTPLPSSRRLAADAGFARGTVVAVYEQLIAEGYLEAMHGSGTRVAARAVGAHTPVHEQPPIAVERIAGHNPGQPDPRLFPRRAWQRSLDHALATVPDGDLRYGDARGDLGLREALCTYLSRTRGITTDADRVIVVNGVAQALAIVAVYLKRTLRSPTIALEDPGSTGAADQLAWWGVKSRRLQVDAEGITTEGLYRHRANAVVVTPAHQYPTGVALSGERRSDLLTWASETDGLIVEDDYDAEYRYDREPLTSLHARARDQVIAVGSVSKSLSPSLRLGWMIVPDRFVAMFAEIKANIDLGTALIPQAALAHFLSSGAMDRHLRTTRTEYRKRRNALLEALTSAAPDCQIGGVAAGLHLVARVGDRASVTDVVSLARACGLDAQPMSRYTTSAHVPSVVLGYGPLDATAARTAGSALGKLLG